MARRYQRDELLRLRASPLVSEPDGLPTAEEWMGLLPAATQGKGHGPLSRARTDESSTQVEGSNKRAGLFENRHVSRGSSTVPEDVVLGPPKTMFASAHAARALGKTTESADKSSIPPNETDAVKNDRYNFREKFFKDRDIGERDGDKRDSRVGISNGRRGGREDREEWTNGRTRRTFGQEEPDRRPKRNGDRDRDSIVWDGKEVREQSDAGYEGRRGNKERDDGRYPPRREGQGRGRYEQSWFRDEAQQETGEGEEEKISTRNREWRRDRAGPQAGDREWNRYSKVERDPEWMNSTEPEESKVEHTQEDFQRWKEKMKATSTQAEEKQNPVTESGKEDVTQPETKREEGEMFSKMDTPLAMESGLDRFFGLWGENKALREPKITEAVEGNARKEALQMNKKSKFAGLFSPAAESHDHEPEPMPISKPQPNRPASTDADHEGFQRILQMLGGGGTKSRNSTPQVDASSQPKPPPYASREDQLKASTTLSSPIRETFQKQDPMYYQDSSPRNRNSTGLESLLGATSPREVATHNRDSVPNPDNSFLLKLMQQPQAQPTSNQSQGNAQAPTTSHTPGVLHIPDLMGRPQGIQKPKAQAPYRPFLDDPAIANMQRPDIAEPRDGLRRRPTNSAPMGFFDEPSYGPPQTNQQHANDIARPQGHGQALPLGMPRLPAFDQLQGPPPSWPNHQLPPQHQHQHQQQGLGLLAPPPGIPNPPPRNMNPFPPGHGPVPLHSGMPPPIERSGGYPRDPRGGGGPGFPPGMPPPGYMNMNGPPPPGFPPMPHTSEGIMGMGPAHFAGNGGGLPPRHMLEMFGPESRRGGMPGPYR